MMDEKQRQWLVAEVNRLEEVERLRRRRLFQFSLLLLMVFVAAALVAWHLLPVAFDWLFWRVFPNGIG
jgi:hypothetical protein